LDLEARFITDGGFCFMNAGEHGKPLVCLDEQRLADLRLALSKG
jgi:hypothetical protein